MFWKRKPTYTPPPPTPPKPMIAKFTVYTRESKLTYSEEYNGAVSYNAPEPYWCDGIVRVGNHWLNLNDVEHIHVVYEEMPKKPDLVGTGTKKGLNK